MGDKSLLLNLLQLFRRHLFLCGSNQTNPRMKMVFIKSKTIVKLLSLSILGTIQAVAQDTLAEDPIRIKNTRTASGKLHIEAREACQLHIVDPQGQVLHNQFMHMGLNEVVLPLLRKTHFIQIVGMNGKTLKTLRLKYLLED